jgi:uncharacterized pyridoxal phosphate-containing UPF0001 family protein
VCTATLLEECLPYVKGPHSQQLQQIIESIKKAQARGTYNLHQVEYVNISYRFDFQWVRRNIDLCMKELGIDEGI